MVPLFFRDGAHAIDEMESALEIREGVNARQFFPGHHLPMLRLGSVPVNFVRR
jgi:hypothetical protein